MSSSLLTSKLQAITGFSTGGVFAAVDFKSLGASTLTSLSDYITSVLTQPMIGIIPIDTERITMVQDVDVSNTMVLSQTTNSNEYITDNTAPKPRVWTLSGYITSLATTMESFLLIKPTLILQKKLLESYAVKRSPIVFKTEYGEIIKKAVIQKLSISNDSKMMNAYRVEATIQEVSVLTTETGTTTSSLPTSSSIKNAGTLTGTLSAVLG